MSHSIANALLNPFLATVHILYPMKTTENLWFSVLFRGYKIRTLARNALILNGQKKVTAYSLKKN